MLCIQFIHKCALFRTYESEFTRVYIRFHAISINLIKFFYKFFFKFFMHFLEERFVKINIVNVRTVDISTSTICSSVETCFIFNPSRLIIFTDCENNCCCCKTSKTDRAMRFLLSSLGRDRNFSGIINVNKKPRWLQTRCLISLCLPSFLLPCNRAERESAFAALGTQNGHGRVSR